MSSSGPVAIRSRRAPGRPRRGAATVRGLAAALALLVPAAASAATPAPDSLAIARAWIDAGTPARAEPVARRAVARAEGAPSRDSLAAALDVLVESLWRQGFATRAETRELAARALSLRDTSARSLDPAAARALLSLGAIRAQNADLAGAAVVLDRALEIRARWPGRDSLDYAWAVHERASLALRAGDLEAARAGLRHVLALRERGLGHFDPLVAWSYSNLASALEATGDLVSARALREECARIRTRALPADHPDRARGLKDLANVLMALGEYGRARSLYDESLRLRIHALGPDHPDVANGLASLASLQLQLGDLASARRSAARALAIRERAFNPDNPEVATSLLQVSRVLAEAGERRAAADSARRALAIRERAFGAEDPVTAIALDALARIDVASGAPDSGCALARRAIAAKTARLGPDHPDVARSWEVLADALAAAGRDAEAVDAALECERIARAHLTASVAQLSDREAMQYEAVRTTGLDLAARLAARAGLDAARRRAVWDAVVRARGRVLDEVAARLRSGAAADVGLADVLARLSAGDALVSYLRCERERYPLARPAEYVAFVALAGADSVSVRALGGADALDRRVDAWRRAVTRAPGADVRGATLARSGAELRRRAWDPLRGALGEARRAIVVPDGALQGVNFYALPAGASRWLVEQPLEIDRLSAERRLARPPAAAAAPGRLVAVGGIRYARPAAGAPGAGDPLAALAPLPRSRHEVETIAALWNRLTSAGGAGAATVLVESRATCAELRGAVPRCEVLHIATHGVFAGAGIDPLGELRDGAASADARSVFQRSGLVLAPAPDAPPGDPDRTAFLRVADVARLDLAGARWVVLSGCGTALGRSLARESLLGLGSAFELAGARVVVMSLWDVEDRWAESWMRELYRARYERRLGTGAAVREASRVLLARRRRLGLDENPSTWAGFIASGLDD